MRECLRELWYIARHKWYVLIFCWKMHVWWLGIVHDWTRLTPHELIPTLRRKRLLAGRVKSSNRAHDILDQFAGAWIRHRHSNKHHWQWWITVEDNGTPIVAEMPKKYCIEMIGDWISSNKCHMAPYTVQQWYEQNKNAIVLWPSSRVFVETMLERGKSRPK